MAQTVIKVENLSKQYRLGTVGTGTLSHDLNRWWHKVRGKEDPYLKIGESNDRASKGESEYVWALKDINFEVKQGEVLGIIGKNGAGKSTLLKILSKVTGPTTGSIKAKGRIASLLEVGTGFHPELTGRENIYLNGTILGMTKREVDKKLDEIVDFAGVARYLDTPVKRYSSGMTVRLGFAVAAHLEPEILVVDEVLAVGDAEFQKKAIGKMQEVSREGGRTVLFVSHNMASVQALCDKAMLMVDGRKIVLEPVAQCIGSYLTGSKNTNEGEWYNPDYEIEEVALRSIRILDNQGNISSYFTNRDPIEIEIELFIIKFDKRIKIEISIENNSGISILKTYHNDMSGCNLTEGKNLVRVTIPRLILNSGNYLVSVGIGIHKVKWMNQLKSLLRFSVDFVTENQDLLVTNKRESIIAPILHWRKIHNK